MTFLKCIKARLVAVNQCPENHQKSYVYLSVETDEKLYGATLNAPFTSFPEKRFVSKSGPFLLPLACFSKRAWTQRFICARRN